MNLSDSHARKSNTHASGVPSKHKPHETQEVSNKIFTLPNFISFLRICMAPIFLVLLFNGFNLAATALFAIAASTDWVDGQVARRTGQVSRLGQILDPTVDVVLMISGVAGLYLVGRLPLWIIAFVVLRDLLLLGGGAFILKRYKVRIDVIYLGKAATTFLYIGFAGLLLNWPLLAGLGLTTYTWLPGFSPDLYSWGIWFVYVGLALGLVAAVYYALKAYVEVKKVWAAQAAELTTEKDSHE